MNNFDSNFTRKLARTFLDKFESKRVLSKNVNTQLLTGKFDPSTGENYDFKRPTDYVSVRTPKGDVSGETPSPIITGKATGRVQDYFTAFVDYDEADEAIKMDQLDELLDPLATRIVTDLELDYADFMMRNTSLLAGTVGTPVTTWDHVANAGAMAEAHGVPQDGGLCYAMNPFTQRRLASDQRSLGGETGAMSANQQATITNNYAGMMVKSCTTLSSYTTGAGADRAGTVAANPDGTYLTAKDTMTQQIAVSGFAAGLEVKAGETVTITDRTRLNLSTRRPIVDENGVAIVWSGTVVNDVTLTGGSGTLTVTGPALFESGSAYNTVNSPITSGDIITLGGSESTLIQPNLFWHKNAFSIGSVPIKKLHSTDTLGTTSDGLQMRVSKGVGFLENQQKVRFDFRPAYCVMNPFLAGKSFGG